MKNLTCIECPRGCNLTIDDNLKVTGNFCIRGQKYALDEISNPKRVVTSTIKIKSLEVVRLPVKTSMPISKKLMFTILKYLDNIQIEAPIKCGDVIIKNICDSGANLIATRTILK